MARADMTSQPPRSILLCSTPRSGSTLLCSLLAASGVAGRPESWFRRQDRAEYAADWDVAADDFPAFLQAAIAAGQSPDGTFACRLMADTREELLTELRTTFPERPDAALLTRAFGPMHYIFLTRRDSVAQAISRYLAETGGLWHRNSDGSVREANPGSSNTEPAYDYAAIDAYRAEAVSAAAGWRAWFAGQGIKPLEMTYEALAADPPAAAARLLSRLGLTPRAPLRAATAKLADARNAEWAARFHADRPKAR